MFEDHDVFTDNRMCFACDKMCSTDQKMCFQIAGSVCS